MTVHALHPCRPIRGPILSDSTYDGVAAYGRSLYPQFSHTRAPLCPRIRQELAWRRRLCVLAFHGPRWGAAALVKLHDGHHSRCGRAT